MYFGPYPYAHVSGQRIGGIWFATQYVDREGGQVEHEDKHEKVVSHAHNLADHWIHRRNRI